MSKFPASRRDFLRAISAGTVGAGTALTPSPGRAETAAADTDVLSLTRPAWEALDLSNGRHLFVDDYLVAAAQNLKLTLHHPDKPDKPFLLGIGSGDDNSQPYATVLYDEERKRFRMWYDSKKQWDSVQALSTVAYLESPDGIHWEKPYKELFQIDGYGMSVTDGGPDDPDPAQRYKMACWEKGPPDVSICSGDKVGISVAFSPDGLHWTKHQPQPVAGLPDMWKYSPSCDPEKKGSIQWRESAFDCMHVTWDPIRKIYVAYVKTPSWPPAEFGYISYKGKKDRRLTSITLSPDFVNWSTPARLLVPEADDFYSIEFGYTVRAKPRGNQMLIWACLLDEAVATCPECHGVGYTVLATSSDLVHCRRMKQPWLDRDADNPQAYDHAMAWVADMITVGDEEYIYYAGYMKGHKNFTDRTLNIARLRKDGFVSRDAGEEWGQLLTPMVRMDADRLTVNAKVRGELRLKILDKSGAALPGFGEDEIAPIRGDSTAHAVKCRGSIVALKRHPVRLAFSLRDAQLYGFELAS